MKKSRVAKSKSRWISSDSSSEDDMEISPIKKKKAPQTSGDDLNKNHRSKIEKNAKKTKKSDLKTSVASSQSFKKNPYTPHRSDSSSSKEFQKPHRKNRVNSPSVSMDLSKVETPSRSDDEDIPVDEELENTLKKYMLNEINNVKRISDSLNIELECLKTYTLDKKIDGTHKSKFLPHKILRISESFFMKIKESQKKFAELYKLWLDDCRHSHGGKTKDGSKRKFAFSSDESDKSEEESDKEFKDESIKTKQQEENASDVFCEKSSKKKNVEVEDVEKNKSSEIVEKDVDKAHNETKHIKKTEISPKVVIGKVQTTKKSNVSTSESYHSCSEIPPAEQSVISECDSEEIFTDDESKILRQKKLEEEMNIVEEKESSDDEEIENTPIKSPSKSIKSLRKTLLMSTTMQPGLEPLEDENEKSDNEPVIDDRRSTEPPAMFENDDREVLDEVNMSCGSISTNNDQQNEDKSENEQTLRKKQKSSSAINHRRKTADKESNNFPTKQKTRKSHNTSNSASQDETDVPKESDPFSSTKKSREASTSSMQNEDRNEKNSDCSSVQKTGMFQKTSESDSQDERIEENSDHVSETIKKSQKKLMVSNKDKKTVNKNSSSQKSQSESEDESHINVDSPSKEIIQSKNDCTPKTNKSIDQDSESDSEKIFSSKRRTKKPLDQEKNKDDGDVNCSNDNRNLDLSLREKAISESVKEAESDNKEDLDGSKNSNSPITDGEDLKKCNESPLISSADENRDSSPKSANEDKNSKKKFKKIRKSCKLPVSSSSSEDEANHKSKKRKLNCSPILGKSRLSSSREIVKKIEEKKSENSGDSSDIDVGRDKELIRENSIEVEIEKAGLENLVKDWSDSEISILGDSNSRSIDERLNRLDTDKSFDSDASTIVVDYNDKDLNIRQKINEKFLKIKLKKFNLSHDTMTTDNSKLKRKRSISKFKNTNLSSDSSTDGEADTSRTPKMRVRTRKRDNSVRQRRSDRSTKSFDIKKNKYYIADPKLRMVCRVTLKQLSKAVLKDYTNALTKSKEFIANKKFDSIINLEGLEAPNKKGKSSKNKKATSKSKSLMEDLDNFGMDELSDCSNSDNDFDQGLGISDPEFMSNKNMRDKIEENARGALLESTSNDEIYSVHDGEEASSPKKKTRSKSVKFTTSKKNEVVNISDDDEEKDGNDWRNDKLLQFKLSDSSDAEEEKWKKSKKKKQPEDEVDEAMLSESPAKKKPNKKLKRRIVKSDSENEFQVSSSSESEKSEEEEVKPKEKKKRQRRRKAASSGTDDSLEAERPKVKRRRIKKTADSDSDNEGSDKDKSAKGRKNIRKVIKDKHIADDTKQAAKDEEERLKRIAQRQKLFNDLYEANLEKEAKVDRLVLDIDKDTKKELVVVHEGLVKKLKPHQADGIKFMWNACFESIEQIQNDKGSGCIIAHCMGLGKTFQVVALAHTLLMNEATKVRTIMVVCPLSTVLNWVNEFKIWLKYTPDIDDIEIYELTKMKKNFERKYVLESWQRTGGVLVIGYEMFRNLTAKNNKKMRKQMFESIQKCLVDPGADLVICDEGHLLKNEDSALSKAMKTVATLRRIVLTGTPLQNNLKEYHCMVQFVKPNLLGTKKEFLNRFVNPITNGQFDDSTEYDVKIMKRRAHVLHRMLKGCVQRFDYSVLTPFLPPKQEYVIFVKLSEFQIKMYQYYLDNCARRFKTANGGLFADFQALQRIWTHPYVLKLNQERMEKANEKKKLEASDSEGSLRDFIDDDSDSASSSSSSSDVQCLDSDEEKVPPQKRSTRNNPLEVPEVKVEEEAEPEVQWWSQFVEDEHFSDMRISSKLLLLFGILKQSEEIGDKVLVFSQSLYSLTLLEAMLNLIDQDTQNGGNSEKLAGHQGRWVLGADYFRLDGSTSPENRSAWCKIFNNTSNTRARLFLISTRAGGLGINLTAANRVIIFDASWNPSHDVQSIFRIYRFGQKKPCYVYRLLAAGTMEEKIYNRQVTKLSLACRVVDEQQIERHYSNHDLAELYQFEPKENSQTVLALPKDRLLAEIFLKYKDRVYNYHEHDSLLENKEEEELDEEERKAAWDEYEAEKQGKLTMNPQNNFYQQFPFLSPSFPGFDSVKELIQRDYPELPPEHLEAVARQAMFDMYRLVEQQQPAMNPYNSIGQAQMGLGNMGGAGSSMNYGLNQPFMQPRPGVNIMPTYSGRGRPPKILNNSNPQYVIPASAMQTPMNQSYPGNMNMMGGIQPGFIGNRVEEE